MVFCASLSTHVCACYRVHKFIRIILVKQKRITILSNAEDCTVHYANATQCANDERLLRTDYIRKLHELMALLTLFS